MKDSSKKDSSKKSHQKTVKKIQQDMTVHAVGRGANARIGTVKSVKRGQFIKLHKRDAPGTTRRYIPLEWVESVKGETVQLSQDANTVRLQWLDKEATRSYVFHRAVVHQTRSHPRHVS